MIRKKRKIRKPNSLQNLAASPRFKSQVDAIGIQAQLRLFSTKVAIVGIGGIGTVVAQYLVRAGIGRITLIDGDTVDQSNLNRQILYDDRHWSGIAKCKVVAAWGGLMSIQDSKNPSTSIESIAEYVDSSNVKNIKDHDIILDCADNSFTRYLINDFCVINNRTLIQGASSAFYGRINLIQGKKYPCLRCYYPSKPTTPKNQGSLGPVCGIVGSWMADMAIRLRIGKTPKFHALYISPLDGVLPMGNADTCYICS